MQGKSQESLKLLQRSLAIYEKTYGANHTQVATNLSSQSWTYFLLGNVQKAVELIQKSLSIRESTFGSQHPNVINGLGMLALYYNAQGDISRAIELRKRSLEISDRNLNIILGIGSERQKKNYMALLEEPTNSAISLHLQQAPNNPQAANLALTTIVRRKGRILDVLSDSERLLRQNLTPENQKLFDERNTIRTRVATLLYSKPKDANKEKYRQEVSEITTKLENIEAELSKRSAEFRSANQPVNIEDVQKRIPSDAALVEFVLYQPSINPKAATKSERYGKPRYAAYILTSQGATQWVDLDSAQTIDKELIEFRKVLQCRNCDVKKVARRLESLLMQPIRQRLGKIRTLLLSPDSQLNLIPFAALVDENNNYLVENYTINYLTTGRDLLRLQTQSPSRQAALVIANPNYNASRSEVKVTNTTRSTEDNRISIDMNSLNFGSLPGTAKEATGIAPLLPGVTVLTESQATENAIKQTTAPSILHIATHGFFLGYQQPNIPDTRSIFQAKYIGDASTPSLLQTITDNTENPLLRSGLALASANSRTSGKEDGILTALEAAGLNLSGTKLVVLSACETGLGDVANGEGVYGLRRAFVIAGSQSQLMTLWKVNDAATSELMVKYYQRLMNQDGRPAGLKIEF
jgi:CHAT domain-containing protein